MAEREQAPPYPPEVLAATVNYFTDRLTEAEVALARAHRRVAELRERRAACRDGGRLTDAEAAEVAEEAEQRAERLLAEGDGDLRTHGGARQAARAAVEGLREAGHPL